MLSNSEATDRGVLLIMGDAKMSYGVDPRVSIISNIVLAGNSGDSDRGDLTSGLFGGPFGVIDACGVAGVIGGGVVGRGDKARAFAA